jgi:hypothetical protein
MIRVALQSDIGERVEQTLRVELGDDDVIRVRPLAGDSLVFAQALLTEGYEVFLGKEEGYVRKTLADGREFVEFLPRAFGGTYGWFSLPIYSGNHLPVARLTWQGGTCERPDPDSVVSVLSSLRPGRNYYAVLEREPTLYDESRYIQTAAEGGGFLLEHQRRSIEEHFQCTVRPLPLRVVIRAFLRYGRCCPAWQRELPWTKISLEGGDRAAE